MNASPGKSAPDYAERVRRVLHLLVRLLSHTPVMAWFRTARGRYDEYFDPQVRQLRSVLRRSRRQAVDVLYLGDSSALFIDPRDVDRRRLPEMLAAELPGNRTALLAGPGYPPALHAEFVRLLSSVRHRPQVVVLSICLRTATAIHVREHPQYGYASSIAALRHVEDPRHRLRAFNRKLRRTPDQWARFEARTVVTRWGMAPTVGAFLVQIRGRRGEVEQLERQRVLFDYFHGETVAPGHPELDDVRRLGEALRAYGVPVVVYWPPIPHDKGEEYFPGEFRAHTEANWRVVQDVLDEALGPLGHLAQSPFETPDHEFVDSADGSEHWNAAGRLRVAALLAAEIRAITTTGAQVEGEADRSEPRTA
jgi:hypothetical protein